MILTVVLILVMSIPATGYAASSTKTASVSNEEGLRNAILNAAVGETIQLQQSIQLTKPLEIPEDKNITLSGSSGSVKLTIHMSDAEFKSAQQSYTQGLLMVAGTLAINSLTVDGGGNMRVMYIGSGANVTLGNGASIINGALGNHTINWGAGIRLEGSRGKLASLTIENGAVIRDNKALGKYYVTGIGICNSRYGNIVMNGGTISGNKDLTAGTARYFSYGGGVALDGMGTSFTMNGGTISGNSAKAAGGGVMAAGIFRMQGGAVTGNTASARSSIGGDAGCGGGVGVKGGTYSGVFEMTGGTISGNKASAKGGAVYMNNQDLEGNLLYPSLAEAVPFLGSGLFSLKGQVQVADNTASGSADNIFLKKGCSLTIAGALNSGSKVYTGSETDTIGTVIAKAGTGYTITQADAGPIKSNEGTELYGLDGENIVLLSGSEPGEEPELETDIRKAELSGVNSSYTYTGKAIQPSPTIVLNGETLKENRDYTLEYDGAGIRSRKLINVGEKTLTITAAGNYEGEIELTYKITAASISKAAVSSIKDQTYAGKACTPSPATVTYNGLDLLKGTDYKITYSGNTKPGRATAKLQGSGNFTGSKSVTFRILPGKATIKKVTSPKKQQAVVTWSKMNGASGYEVMAAYNSKFTKGKKIKTVKGSGLKATISGLKSKNTCYVKVRAYTTISGKKCYGAYSSVKKIKIK